MEYVITAVSSFVLGLILVPLAMKAAGRFGIMDRPHTKLKKHKAPVPYLGGLAIYLSFVIPVIAYKIIMHQELYGVVGILAGATLMVAVGLYDDIKNLNPYAKLAAQLVTALIILKVNMHIKFMDNNILNYILTVLWVVGVTNSMNLIDIMDGLAGGVAAVATLAFFAVALLANRVNGACDRAFRRACGFLIL